uniref:Putative secreted protein n=1 Tax=Anopheles darlingi TaxID=43151 RepID=A0A2M4D3M0_ANODA
MSCASSIILLRTTVGSWSVVPLSEARLSVVVVGSIDGSGTGSSAERSGISDTPSVRRRALPTLAIMCCCSCWLRSSSRPRAESELAERVTFSRCFMSTSCTSSWSGSCCCC